MFYFFQFLSPDSEACWAHWGSWQTLKDMELTEGEAEALRGCMYPFSWD